MAVNKGGRPPAQVDKDIARELVKAGQRRAKAQDALNGAINDLDSAISSAYMAGVPARQISLHTGISEKSIRVSLVRSGAIAD